MNLEGLVVGVITFLLIGLFHPLVIKGEYYFGTKINIAFIAGGIIFALLSILVNHLVASILLGVTSCCSFWSIHEIKEQEERVLKGWFPENPSRREYYNKKRQILNLETKKKW
ncbi:MAG: DUF4491 family protein [Tissierellia bacterium]|nr:DUF4491 family protein [Tissierellia bacterium]